MTSLHRPGSVADAASLLAAVEGEARAGGTDVQERRRAGRSHGDVIDLTGVAGLDGIEALAGGSVRIGALVRVHRVATDRQLAAYPALQAAAGALATPQLRRQGTLGGNLLQRVRCTYSRTEGFCCLHDGGDECLARTGYSGMHVVFDESPCIAPHASTVAVALLTYHGCMVEVHGAPDRTIAALYEGLADPRRDHALGPGDVLTGVRLPPAAPGEGGHYLRAISRSRAEWPLVEAAARIVLDGSTVRDAGVAAGGVARAPRALPDVEAALVGRRPDEDVIEAAAALAAAGATPAPGSAFKVPLLTAVVADAIRGAVAAAARA
jgi:xanthine dehydrogenase YagS FAD-binding subunit